MRKANIEDVAAKAGVSIKTVSRVLNKEPNVRESTKARVQEAIKELNYRPNPSARSLAGVRAVTCMMPVASLMRSVLSAR